MIIDFQQGIITYPSSGAVQRFLAYDSGYVNLTTTDGRVDVAFAHGAENYLHTEASSVTHAWGPIVPTSDAWLFWDIDALTAVRTFGITYFQPAYGATPPAAPQGDQHWFDTVNRKMMVYRSGKWLNKIRVFACKINNNVISPIGSNPSKPYAGTQVGIAVPGIAAGRIIVDVSGTPIRRQDGLLFTTEDEFFVNGSPVNTIRLEANVLNGTANENIARYQVVKFTEFGKVNLATYDDEQTTAIAMAMEDVVQGQTGTLCMQGVVTNPEWNWTAVGTPLWIHGSIPGLLVDYDPHVQNSVLYQSGKPPVARVLTPTSVFFDQGLGGKGDKGDQGAAMVPLATNTLFGISKLSLAATNPANPIVVGDNDPRNFNDRYPLPHSQAASTITTLPYGVITSSNMQDGIELINDNFVKRAGDSMTGYLTLSADPAVDLHAATKHYVDTRTLDNLADVTITSPVVENVLKFDGNGWVNGPGQVAQLWMSSNRSSTVAWVPATASSQFVNCQMYSAPYATAGAVRGASANLNPPNLPSMDIGVTINGSEILTTFADLSNVGTVGDLVATINADPALSAVVTASVGTIGAGTGILITAKLLSDVITQFICDPIDYAATNSSDYICNYGWDTYTNGGFSVVLLTIDDCDLNVTYTDPAIITNIDLGFAPMMEITVDGVPHHTTLTSSDINNIGTIGDIIDLFNARFGAYAHMTASGDDTGFSGVIITSTQNTVTNLEFTGWKMNVLNSTGSACSLTYPTPVPGVPYSNHTVDPILTPSPHTPAFKETYIPMHTFIDSDTPVMSAPYWLDSIGDSQSAYYCALMSVGQVAVGTPGTATSGVRQTDTVYVVGSVDSGSRNTSGVMVEVRYPSNEPGKQAGELITTDGYAGRIVIPITKSGTTMYDVYGVGVGVGNASGGVYVLAGMYGAQGYGDNINLAAVICLNPTLTAINWIRTIDLGINSAPNTAWLEVPRSGFCVNKLTNISYAAIQTVYETPPQDMYSNAIVDTGVTVVALDPVGNTIWTKSLFSNTNSTNNWAPLLPSQIAVHESTGDVVVAYDNCVAKLSGVDGSVLWCTVVDGCASWNEGIGVHAVTVDQTTGDVFIAAYQDVAALA